MNSLKHERKFGFESWDKEKINKVFSFAQDYKYFISENKTEREVVKTLRRIVEKQGFVEIDAKDYTQNKPKKVFKVNRDKSIVLGIFGKKPVKEGIKMVLSHIDSPRIDLKPHPLYENEKIAWFKTQYYGGIKKYQWPAMPLAIHGVVVLENGQKVEIKFGEKEDEPVLTITDLLPHLSAKQMEKKLEEAVEAEEMNVVVGSVPTSNSKLKTLNSKSEEGKDLVKLGVLELLNKKYGIIEEDLVSADLEIVPAGKARDLGFDSSMIGGYGQDDRVCAFTSLQALLSLDEEKLGQGVVLVFADKEETGSESNTGSLSSFIPDFISEMLFLEEGKHDENLLRDCLSATKAISADVTVAYDPDYTSVFDPQNTARLGAGIAVEKYCGRRGKSGTSEASAEYLGEIRRIFNKKAVLWQTGGLGKVDLGGGGTIAVFLARHNMDVVDAGPPILSMHSPFEISSKIDVYSCFEAYQAFLSS
ncbi:aminopeptidase [Candidatus Microgenomates bacterium]|jgi:aspartyl aminopeptidase|nr:MAG: aminopeptidase [Candidatus Microgenomates bacterium]